MTKAFETFEDIFAPVLSGPEFRPEEYARRKRQAAKVLQVLQQHFNDYADAQVGNPPPDMAANEPIMQFSLVIRWPKQFRQLQGKARSELRNLFVELLELGCVFHQLNTPVPLQPDPPVASDIWGLRTRWLSEAYAADYVMQQTEKQAYQGLGAFLLKRVTDEKVLPFYKSHGIRGGFLGWNLTKLSGHTKMLFYAGARLAMLYDISSEQCEDGTHR